MEIIQGVATSRDFIELPLNNRYTTDIRGIGELYEIISVNKLRKRLLKTYSKGILFLLPRGSMSMKGLSYFERKIEIGNRKIIEKGFVDCPPWRSNPKEGDNDVVRHKFLKWLSIILIHFLINFEFLWRKRGHIVYFLIQ